MIALGRMTPLRVVFLTAPLAGVCIGGVLMRTEQHVHWLPGLAVLVATIGVAANLAFQYLILRFLIRILRRRGVRLLDGVAPGTTLALLAAGTAVAAVVVFAAVRVQPGVAGAATAMFTGLTLLAAMTCALALEPERRLPARRALVLVFASQFVLTLVLRVV